MFGWLRKILARRAPSYPWRVCVRDGQIFISDAQGTQCALPISELCRVVVATDDSGPWGDDVVFLLYSDSIAPVGLFPLEAAGCGEFVHWVSNQPGFRDQELAKAMGSTNVARFTVWEAPA